MANKHTKNAHLHEPSEKCKSNHVEIYLIPVGVAVTKKTSNSKSSVKMGTKENPTHFYCQCKLVHSTKINKDVSQKHKSGLNPLKELSQHRRET